MLVRLHRWLGVALSAWLAIACLSGLLLLWKDDYYGLRYSTLPDSPTLIEPNGQIIAQILDTSSRPVRFLGMPTQSLPAYHAYYEDGGEALLHPETAEIIADWTYLDALPAFLFELHVHLLLGDAGHTLVGWLGVLAMTNILLGIALWLRKRQVFRARFFLPKTASRAWLMRAHAAQGSVLAAALLLLVFSGVAVVFAGPVQAAFNAALGASEALRPLPVRVDAHDGKIDWPAVIETGQLALPGADLRFIYLPSDPSSGIALRLRNAGELHPNGRSYVVTTPTDYAALQTIDATQTGLGPSAFDSLYPLHAGKTGWPGYRFVVFVMALSFVYIAASGAYLFTTRPRVF